MDLELQGYFIKLGEILVSAVHHYAGRDGGREAAAISADEQTVSIMRMLQSDRSLGHIRSLIGVSREGYETHGRYAIRIVAFLAHRCFSGTESGHPSFGEVAKYCGVGVDGSPSGILEARDVLGRMAVTGRVLLTPTMWDECDADCRIDLAPDLMSWFCGGGKSLAWLPYDKFQKIRAKYEAENARKSSAIPMPPPIPKPRRMPSVQGARPPSAREIFETARHTVIGIDTHLAQMTKALAWHLLRTDCLRRGGDFSGVGNCVALVCGVSGSGKSWMVGECLRAISSCCPSVSFDAGSLSVEGYVGMSVSAPLKLLIEQAHGDPNLPYGCIHLQEIDKKINETFVSGVGTLQSLLVFLEGGQVTVGGRRGSWDGPVKSFDCKGLGWILNGAHSRLYDQMDRRTRSKGVIGFGMGGRGRTRDDALVRESLIAFGYPEEIVNRLSHILILPVPTPETVSSIVTAPTGIIASCNSLLSGQGVSIELTPQAVALIADVSCQSHGYARHAKAIITHMIQEILWAGDRSGIVRLGTAEVKRAVESGVSSVASDNSQPDDSGLDLAEEPAESVMAGGE